MVGKLIFRVRPWVETNDRSILLKIINARNSYTNPDFAVELKDNAIENWFGKDPVLSRDVLQFENKEGKIVGFVGLTSYSGSVKTFRVIHAILPDYFLTELPQLVVEAAIEFGKKQGLSKLIFPIFGSASAPFDVVMNEKGISPAVYIYDMVMSDTDSSFQPEIPKDVKFQELPKLEEYKEYVQALNDAFQNSFEFSESTSEEVKKHIELVTSHGLEYMHCLAFLNNTLVGVCNYYFYPKEFKGVIESVSVKRNHQHCGIGSGLFSFCIQSLKKRGSKKIMVGVRVERKDSLKFFERFGFISDENRVQKYYQII